MIYYPYLRIPENEWFNRVVLYWDKFYVFSTSYHLNSGYGHRLVSSGLVEPISLYELDIDLDYFLDFVDSEDYPVDPENWEASVSMFHEKMEVDLNLTRGLMERGLMRISSDWYRVEAYTAKQYMAFLAKVISQDKNATPLTDRQMDLDSFLEVGNEDAQTILQEEARRIILKNILPVPRKINGSKKVNPDSIAKFKDKHYYELKNFRDFLQKELRHVSSLSNPKDREEETEYIIERAQSNIEDIMGKMQDYGWLKIIRSNLDTLVLPGAAIAATVATGGIAFPLIFPAMGIGIKLKKIGEDKKLQKKLFKKNVYAYMVSAKQEFSPLPKKESFTGKMKRYTKTIKNSIE